MAVFPDRIVLKNSSDSEADIRAAIELGGSDEIAQGEIVLGIESSNVTFYTRDINGNIVSLGSATQSVSNLDDLSDVTITAVVNGQALVYNGSEWVNDDIFTSPLTANGDLLYRVGSVDTRLAIGTAGSVLTSSGNAPAWEIPFSGVIISTTPPTLRPGGTSLQNGDQWLDSDDEKLYVRLYGEWLEVGGDIVGSIDDLSDVDTSTNPPTQDQVLIWDGTNWIPGDQTGGSGSGVTSIIAGAGISIDQSTGDVTVTATGGGGGGGGSGGGSGSGVLESTKETQTAASGIIDFVGLGASGIFAEVTSSLDAWIVFYPTAALRTADASRAFGDDPVPGSGVLAEFSISAGGTALASPGTTYFNNDTIGQEKIYAAVRTQGGADLDSEVTVRAYARRSFNGFGTNRVTETATAASGHLDVSTLGQAGQLVSIQSSLDAWVVMYGSAADRSADSSRLFSEDPLPGSGVQAEFYISGGSTVLGTPGATYFNNDSSPTESVYFAVRDAAGVDVDSQLTIVAYAETSFTGVSGGSFGSG
jgi:hypothetical protein